MRQWMINDDPSCAQIGPAVDGGPGAAPADGTGKGGDDCHVQRHKPDHHTARSSSSAFG